MNAKSGIQQIMTNNAKSEREYTLAERSRTNYATARSWGAFAAIDPTVCIRVATRSLSRKTGRAVERIV